MSEPTRIPVRGTKPYDVVVGHGLLGELAGMVEKSQRVAVVHPEALTETAETVRKDLEANG
ncbi:MAG: 3-dehydroquinate synthase, partial [Frankiales bacterium]|nr:3-dehydroquinate synthase [Frankiales bacterium]